MMALKQASSSDLLVECQSSIKSGAKVPVEVLAAEKCEVPKKRALIYLHSALVDCSFLRQELDSQGWLGTCCETILEAGEAMQEQNFSVGLLDIEILLDSEVRAQWELLRGRFPYCEWIASVAPAAVTDPSIRHLIVEYFYDFQTRPIDSSILANTLGHASGMAFLRQTAAENGYGCNKVDGIIGSSPVMQKLFKDLYKIKAVEAPILIGGESGTGKELVAQSIHRQSRRKAGNFVAVNCGAIPANLIQSELFGYEKGAFTGAFKCRIGKIEQASGGTIFLDEIGDLPLEAQINLLRFLQEKTIERVGGSKSITCDVRVIAATHVDLEKAVSEGRFREDLYHRLNVIHISVPALRERGEDIEGLARAFFERYADERSARVRGFSREAIDALYRHHWPGNVRELINRVRQALVMSENALISAEDLRLEKCSAYGNGCPSELAAAKATAEKQAIVEMLGGKSKSMSQAARNLGISRATLYRLLDKYEIRVPETLVKHGGSSAAVKIDAGQDRT
ncbi:sigma-54 dependent transcriptional regulator [Methylococcus sp. EFPC2]|uniref:sigma-54 dependent transcriptional regulator n=1 Tax=Methylococcus sp. EFPC2 TaxID=2812648 RepID=UPI001967F807|nr:sigma-54 dependent transcriptional regulator [Methylococcus sp. EFPC2]QSA96858.1 sigma-54-dependent Fis family transcriptional regulator [Methylococcus sp. EFPC2]